MPDSNNQPLIVSVVRDAAMYSKCIKDNDFLQNCELLAIDNTEKNEPIPILYNRAIGQLDLSNDRWIVFAHEDFEPKEPLSAALSALDRNAIWGPIGAVTVSRWPWLFGGYKQGKMRGFIETCQKDESQPSTAGTPVPCGTAVETLDCMFLAVHSSLLQKTHLRFDENLTFDLYSEDFSMQAKFNHGIPTRIVPIKCKHHSGSGFAPRFYKQRNYLKRKYPKGLAISTTSYFIGGGGSPFCRLQILFRDLLPR